MDLKEFYFQNIKESEYHHRFLNSVKKVNYTYNLFTGEEETQDYQFEIYDVEEAITKFKELCQPDVNFSPENKCWFYLITYYLNTLGYEIKEFPRILARPPAEPADFTYGEIRNRIIALGGDDNGTVRYATRRAFVAELTFMQKSCNIEVSDSINQKFIEISTRQASFNCMHTDEKIAEIANLIENMLKQDGKFITPEYEKVCCGFIDDTLGDGYTPADLRAVIAGEKAHTPRKNAAASVKPEKRSGNLLVDIQTKLRAGKGAGYARWATLFNLKQMAQTVAYLQDHELLDYAVLSEKAAEASAHFNELSARIKSAEKRMAEIAVLREHIANYAKTRDTYVAYRKAGYSKKFLAEHESEITIHKAAKNYFDGLGFKKLPTIKALNTEYAELLAEKKAAYADYRKAREEMKELLTAKANIDRILELDKEQEEANERREKEAEQR